MGDYKQNQIPAQYWGLSFRVCKCRTLNPSFAIVKCKGGTLSQLMKYKSTACIFPPGCPSGQLQDVSGGAHTHLGAAQDTLWVVSCTI